MIGSCSVSRTAVTENLYVQHKSSVTVTSLHQCSVALSKAAGLHRFCIIGGVSGLQLASGHRERSRNCHIALTTQIDGGTFKEPEEL